jgi:1-deoxy-D-xylulose-5-phosphate synthase
MSGYPNRAESEHDWIENSHASTALSYAHGLARRLELCGELIGSGGTRKVVAVVGDGALTGGMAYEALNNLGHSGAGSSSCSTTTGAPTPRPSRSSRRA